MGDGIEYKCEKCGKNYFVMTGIGMGFPHLFRETIDKIKKGKYGKRWKQLINSQEYVIPDCETELYRCSCGYWETSMVLDLYAPKDPQKIEKKMFGKKSVKELGEIPYISGYEIKRQFVLLEKYKHSCPECGSEMKKSWVSFTGNRSKLSCPKCGTKNSPVNFLKWD